MNPAEHPRGSARKSARYRIYFWLMDACFVAGVILPGGTFVPEEWVGEWAFWLLGVPALILVGGVTPFLITARFMRDDYAEGIWQRSVAILTLVMVIVPAVFLIVGWPIYLLVEPSRSPIYKAYYEFYVFIDTPNPVRDTLMMAWLVFNLSFVAIFQFLRWKDSR